MRGTTPFYPHTNSRGLYENGTIDNGTLLTNGVAWPGQSASAYLGWTPRAIPYEWFGSLVTEQADASGLLYRRNRYYDPAVGRFTQPDPIGIAGGLNSYGFANGDPVNFSDPFGLCPKDMGGDGKSLTLADCPLGSEGRRISSSGAVGSPGILDPLAIATGLFASRLLGAAEAIGTPGAQLLKNKLKGDAFRDEIADLFRQAGYDVRTEVTKRSAFGTRRIDIEVSKLGRVLGGIETKTGNSRYTPSQRAKDAALRALHDYWVNVVRQ